MSTATAPERSHAPYAEPDEYIDYQLRKTQTGIKRNDMLTAGAVAVTLVIGYVLLFVLADHWLFDGGASPTIRWLMLLPVLGAVGWLVGSRIVIPAIKNVSGLFAAKTLETSAPEFRSSLLSLIDLKRAERPVSPVILATMEKRAAVTLTKLNVEDAIDKRPLLHTLCVLFGVVVVFCAYSVLSPKSLSPSVLRAFLPFANVTPATQTEILEVKPGDAKIRAGDSLPVSVTLRASGEIPANVTLLFTTADRRFVDEPFSLNPTTEPTVFEGIFGDDGQGLLQSFSYRIAAGDAHSSDYQVTVTTPPSATVTEQRYQYPDYMELEPLTQMGGAIDVWEQTTVTLHAEANVPVARAEFEFADTEDFASAYPGPSVKISGKKLTIGWQANARQSDGKFPKFYRVKVWDADGSADPKPAVYPINVRLDQPPQVVLLAPTTNLEMPSNGTVPLVVAARDPDFKLARVSLKFSRDDNDVTDETLSEKPQSEIQLEHDFALEPLRLKSGDKIRFWIEAQDNKLPTHNLAKTPPLEITIQDKVSKEEAQKQLADQKREQKQKLDEAQNDQNATGRDRSQQEPNDSGDQPPSKDSREPMPGDDRKQEQNQQASDADQNQQGKPQPGDKAGKNQGGQSGKQSSGDKTESSKNGEGQVRDSQSGQAGEKSSDSKSGQPSLKSDGSDDQQALEKILEKRGSQKPQRGNPDKRQGSGEKSDENTGESSENSPPNGDNKNSTESPPAQNGTDNKSRAGQKNSANNQPADDSQSEKPDAEKAGSSNDRNDQKSPRSQGSPQEKSANGSKTPNSDGEKTSPPEKGRNDGSKGTDPKGANPKGAGESPQDNQPNKPGEKGTDPKSGDSNKPMTGEKSPSENSAGKTGEDQKPDGKGSEKGASPDQKSSPMKSGSDNKSSPGKTSPKDGSRDDKSADDPKTDPAGTPKPNDRKNDDAGSPTGKSSSGAGQEKSDKEGAGKPSSKPSDPNDKSASGEGSDGDKGSSSKKKRGNRGEKPNDDSTTNDKGDEGSPSKKTDDQGSPKKSQTGAQESSDTEESGDKGSSSKSSQGSKPSNSKGDSGKSASKSGQGSSGKSTGGGSTPGQGVPGEGTAQREDGGQPDRTARSSDGSGSGDSSQTEEADPEAVKHATDLALKRLKDEIERGEVDRELLDELGWTEEQMKKFVERMQQQLEDKGDDNSPAAQARRRQFEEMLRNLDFSAKTQRRDDTNKDKQSGEAIGTSRRQAPAEYREAFERYTKRLSKKQTPQPPKK